MGDIISEDGLCGPDNDTAVLLFMHSGLLLCVGTLALLFKARTDATAIDLLPTPCMI